MKPIKESGAGKLYEANGFLVPVVTGTAKEMGTQYGALMVEAMQHPSAAQRSSAAEPERSSSPHC